MNLLEETKSAITNSGHKIDDIQFIGSKSGYSCTWDEYVILADIDYDSGFGASEVAKDLIIVFKDGQTMWRGEYNGSEWWEYSVPFSMPEEAKTIKRLVGDYWPSLENLHDDSDHHHNPNLKNEKAVSKESVGGLEANK